MHDRYLRSMMTVAIAAVAAGSVISGVRHGDGGSGSGGFRHGARPSAEFPRGEPDLQGI